MKIICLLLLSVFAIPARADCIDDAAQYHQVNPWIVRAIVQVESGANPAAMHRNANGTLDVGIAQINQVHMPELASYQIAQKDLLDACVNVYTSAWLLRRSVNRYGNTWAAVGAYNSSTPRYRDIYSTKVRRVIDRWKSAGLIPE